MDDDEIFSFDPVEEQDLHEKALSYPKRHDPAFQKFIDSIEDEIDDEKCYYNLVILKLIVNGFVELSLGDTGEILFNISQHN